MTDEDLARLLAISADIDSLLDVEGAPTERCVPVFAEHVDELAETIEIETLRLEDVSTKA